MTGSNPAASSTSMIRAVPRDTPPRWPREATDRRNTRWPAPCPPRRTRPPRIAPPVTGLEGSTATTPIRRPRRKSSPSNALIRVDLPVPGTPVMPITCARPSRADSASRTPAAAASSLSTAVIARAIARRSPASSGATSGCSAAFTASAWSSRRESASSSDRFREARRDLRRECDRPPRLGVEVRGGDRRRGEFLLRLDVVHAVREAHHLRLHFLDLRADADERAGMDLALVVGVLLERCHAAAVRTHVRAGDAEVGEQLPARLVEAGGVEADVHVASVVHLPRIDRTASDLELLAHLDDRLHMAEAECSPEPAADLAVGAARLRGSEDLLEHVRLRRVGRSRQRIEGPVHRRLGARRLPGPERGDVRFHSRRVGSRERLSRARVLLGLVTVHADDGLLARLHPR